MILNISDTLTEDEPFPRTRGDDPAQGSPGE